MRFLVLFPVLLAATLATAQCSTCIPDVGCTASPAYPTLCPLVPPDATAGTFYETTISFWMPTVFTDPGTGVTVNFEQMTITDVSGLPFGLEIQYDQPAGVYYPQQEQYGCARICGVPLLAGTYPVTISILAGVSFSGFSIDSPQQFVLQLTVLPGSGGNAGFSFTPSTGCGSALVQFEALIDGSPSPTAYAWNFGDGTFGTDTAPLHAYPMPGNYTVTLETTIGGYVLQEVALTGVNGNWCGDVEEPNLPLLGCQGSPDPYFTLTDAQGGTYTSATVDNTFTATWDNLGLLLDNPPYSFTFFDEDAVSATDQLGTYNMPENGAGTYTINVAGGTTGSLQVAEAAQSTFTHVDSILVFPLPELVLNEDPLTGELCVEDTTLASFLWFQDGDTVPGFNGPCVAPTGPGLWSAQAANVFGCIAQSDTVIVCPTVTITQNGPVLQVTSGFVAYAWTYQGDAVGGNDPFVVTVGDGLYTVTITDANGCVVTASHELITTGIHAQPGTARSLVLFPVPNGGIFSLTASGLAMGQVLVRILDAQGREIHAFQAPVVNRTIRATVEQALAPGVYLLQVLDGGSPLTARFLVR